MLLGLTKTNPKQNSKPSSPPTNEQPRCSSTEICICPIKWCRTYMSVCVRLVFCACECFGVSHCVCMCVCVCVRVCFGPWATSSPKMFSARPFGVAPSFTNIAFFTITTRKRERNHVRIMRCVCASFFWLPRCLCRCVCPVAVCGVVPMRCLKKPCERLQSLLACGWCVCGGRACEVLAGKTCRHSRRVSW